MQGGKGGGGGGRGREGKGREGALSPGNQLYKCKGHADADKTVMLNVTLITVTIIIIIYTCTLV